MAFVEWRSDVNACPYTESVRRAEGWHKVDAAAILPFLAWPGLRHRLLATNFLPHLYCYLSNPILVWTHVIADGLIASSYLAISFTLTYVVFKAWRDLPFHWILLAFGLFIIACGGTHVMEVLTI